MRDPVVDEQGDAGIGEEVGGFFVGGLNGEEDYRGGRRGVWEGVGGSREEGEVHEGDVRPEAIGGGQVELWGVRNGCWRGVRGLYVAGIFEAGCDIGGELVGDDGRSGHCGLRW